MGDASVGEKAKRINVSIIWPKQDRMISRGSTSCLVGTRIRYLGTTLTVQWYAVASSQRIVILVYTHCDESRHTTYLTFRPRLPSLSNTTPHPAVTQEVRA